jgi:hypothetical protein
VGLEESDQIMTDRSEHDFRGVGELCLRCKLPETKHRKRKFVGIACRGGDVDGKHVLLEMVAVREDGATVARASAEDGLGLNDCLRVLFSTSKRDVCFGFGTSYDATKIFEGVGDGAGELEKFYIFHPESRVMTRDGKTFTPLFRYRGHGYGFDSSGYTVARGRSEKRWKQTVRVWNIEAMTRRSFDVSLKNWEIDDDVSSLKDRALAIARLARAVTAEIREWGVDLGGRYRGPGSIAGTILRSSGVASCNGVVAALEDDVMSAYFGGRQGVCQIGPVLGKLREYDLTSAYAAAMRDLPCLACGEWAEEDASLPAVGCKTALVRFNVVRPDVLTAMWWAPLPCRVDGDVVYGVGFEGVAWWPEVHEAMIGWPGLIEVTGKYFYKTSCSHRPFHFIDEWFARRFALGEACLTGPSELVKQTLAAVYGKVAQRFPSDLQSYVWAGLTTALVRARLLKVIAAEDVFAVETDSVILRGKLRTGEGLGDWKLREEFPKGVFLTSTGSHFDLGSKGVEEREIRRAFKAGEESAVFRQRAFHDGRSATIAMVRCRRCSKSWSLSQGLLCPDCRIVGGVPRGGFLETRPYGTWGWEGREVGLARPEVPDLGGRRSEAFRPEKR